MNPVTLLEAFGERTFLIGLGLGIGAGLLALVHRRLSAWFVSIGLAATIGLVLGGRTGTLPDPPVWLVVSAGIATLLASWGSSLMVREVGAKTTSLCLAVTALGVWGTVPDTEHALVVLGVAFGALVGVFRFDVPERVHAWSPILFFGAAGYVAITEGLARDSAPIGALAAMGMLLVYPAVVWTGRSTASSVVLAVHVAVVVFVGRVAGTAGSAIGAATLSAVGLSVGAIAVVWLRRRETAPT